MVIVVIKSRQLREWVDYEIIRRNLFGEGANFFRQLGVRQKFVGIVFVKHSIYRVLIDTIRTINNKLIEISEIIEQHKSNRVAVDLSRICAGPIFILYDVFKEVVERCEQFMHTSSSFLMFQNLIDDKFIVKIDDFIKDVVEHITRCVIYQFASRNFLF